MATIVEKRFDELEFSLGPINPGTTSLDSDKYIQDTSLEAIPSELKREAMNKQVWYFLRGIPDSTMKEVSKGLNIPIQTICWRIHDLRDEDSIEETGTKICEGKLMKTWKTKPLRG